MKRSRRATASAQNLLKAAEEHTINAETIQARLELLLGDSDAVATGADVAQALSGRTKPLKTWPFHFAPDEARKHA